MISSIIVHQDTSTTQESHLWRLVNPVDASAPADAPYNWYYGTDRETGLHMMQFTFPFVNPASLPNFLAYDHPVHGVGGQCLPRFVQRRSSHARARAHSGAVLLRRRAMEHTIDTGTAWRLTAIQDQKDFAELAINEALDALHVARKQAQYGKFDHLVKLIDATYTAIERAANLSALEDEINELKAE